MVEKMVPTLLEDVMTEEGADKAYESIVRMAQKYAAQLNDDEQESA